MIRLRDWLLIPLVAGIACLMLNACGNDGSSDNTAGDEPALEETFVSNTPVDLQTKVLANEVGYITSQCYTKTEDDQGNVYNPCYACHMSSVTPNYVNDYDLQQEYSFPETGRENPWSNLFEDRSARITAISDPEILDYVKESNYFSEDGEILLARRMSNVPDEWDYDSDGQWDGYVPDCYFNFDAQGFDRDPQGNDTGWRAFAYYPFLGTFWPTNGSTDDVIIRLAPAFRQNASGEWDRTVYRVNLAIVEALTTRRDIPIEPVDENALGVDLDKNGELATAERVVFDWAPLDEIFMSYVGQAGLDQEAGEVHLAAGLFPEGTEFIHSVRYIDVSDDDRIGLAPRMKELRYMIKRTWQTYADLEDAAAEEVKEKSDFPDRTNLYIGDMERGVNNGTGWLLQGFIEDIDGELRPQNFEETTFCIGCHGGIGATTDSVFSFPRKLGHTSYQRGWYHWSQKGLDGVKEPKVKIKNAGVYYEYSYYLMYNRSGSEFRQNAEVKEKFFNSDGSIKDEMLDALHDDITVLINPSAERALQLNKAYRTIVLDQDFTLGRDANLTPIANVHQDPLEENQAIGVAETTAIEGFSGCFAEICPCAPDEQQDPLLDAQQTAILGRGVAPPDGERYEVDWHGIIGQSQYSLALEGVYFTFPPRLSLPTRVIVPLSNIPSCYACHRLDYPTVEDNKQITEPVSLSATEATSAEALMLTQLTDATTREQGGLWSPDGTRIAYISDASGSAQLWLMNADGSDQTQLTFGADTVSGWHDWSRDGQRLAYWNYDSASGMHAIKTIAIDGSDEQTLVSSANLLDRPDWGPGDEYIAYAEAFEGNWDLYLIKSDGTDSPIRLTSDPQMETNPLWSPDGEAIAYKVAPHGEYNLTEQFFMTFENGYADPTLHTWDGPQSVQMNDWSPNGEQIVYTAEVISGASGEDRVSYVAMISDVALLGENAVAEPTLILSKGCTLGDRGPVFSPDGEKVAFWAWDTHYRATLWLYDQQAEDLQQITTSGHDMYPMWSPDGSQLLFESFRDGSSDLWLLDLEQL